MAKIILIETSAADCTVALGVDGVAVARAKAEEPRSHASMTAPLVKQVLDEAGLKVADCDAVCLSKGPGSYTGLRVGSSTAKGLCFGASLPLLAIPTPGIIAAEALSAVMPDPDRASGVAAPFRHIVTMIDARRMEVYCSVFDASLQRVADTQALVVDADAFADWRKGHRLWLFGDGAPKLTPLFAEAAEIRIVDDLFPSAAYMAALSHQALQAGKVVDVAYFEPYYLKDFVAGKPHVKGL